MSLSFLLKVSRPRFWIYLLGPFLVGIAAAVSVTEDFLNWRVLLFAIYFTFPANLFVYGINDIFDHDTDVLNEKKREYEALVSPDRRLALWAAVAISNLPFLIFAIFALPAFAILPLFGFVFFGAFYSAPPIRAKAIPFLDSAFNILYVMPGMFAYLFVSGNFPSLRAFVAVAAWTSAMHAFSAIPDIEADRGARLSTIATVCGTRGTLFICGLLYLAAGILAVPYLGYLSGILTAAYLLMILISFAARSERAFFRVYTIFPLLNMAAGFVIFWWLAWPKFF